MARASTITKLPLDRWAEILGINPLHFNQLYSELTRQTCGQVYYQFAHQDAHKISREDIARAIRTAEDKIEGFVNYNLLPDWYEETILTPRPIKPELYGAAYNPRFSRKSVGTRKGHLVSGGQRVKELIEALAPVVRTDNDGDSFDELCTVTVTTTVTDGNEIRAYYNGESGADQWEIRPIDVSISGGVATITFKVWQIVDPDLQQGFGVEVIDADDATNFLTTVDIYRVYNDPQTQALFMWESLPDSCDCGSTTCQVCAFATQYGCLQIRDNRLGYFTYAPANWDADDEEFNPVEWALCREPEKVRLWYYSGWEDPNLERSKVVMDNFWAEAVVKYSVALLDKNMCECTNVSNFLDHWREDRARVGAEVSYQITPSISDNEFGSRNGALFARACCMQEGRRVAR